MPVSFNGVPFKLTAQDMGVADLGAALMQGFEANRKQTQAINEPKIMAEQLLASQLGNKLKANELKYAEPYAQSQLANLEAQRKNYEAQRSLTPYHQKLYEAQINRQNQLANQPIITPEMKEAAEINTKATEEQNKYKIKEINSLENDIPKLKYMLEKVRNLKKITETDKDLFGPGAFGFDFGNALSGGPSYRAKFSKNPNLGIFDSGMLDIVGIAEKSLSDKGNILALKNASSSKANRGEQPEVARGKLESMEKDLMASLERSQSRYDQLKGKGKTLLIGEDGAHYEVPNDQVETALSMNKGLRRG